jgi:hypothetical protein
MLPGPLRMVAEAKLGPGRSVECCASGVFGGMRPDQTLELPNRSSICG